MNKLLTITILVLNVAISNAQYKLRISDLNTRYDYQLQAGQTFYYQNKFEEKVQKVTFKKALFNNHILVDDKTINVDSISWISLHNYHDNNFRVWARNSIPNLHIAKLPNYDLETSHLAEVVIDTTLFNLDSNAFPTPTNKQLLRMHYPRLFYNFTQQLISPFRASGSQWGVTIASAAVFYGTLKVDKQIDDNVRSKFNNNKNFINTNKYITYLGSYVGLGFTYGWLACGLLLKNNKATETALLASQALITSTIWNRLLKYTTLRERPYSAFTNSTNQYSFKGPSEFKNLWNNSDYHSLGSGHTATAFAIATVFAEQYKQTPWVAITSYTLAAAVGASRIGLHKHWTSDVLVGALIGVSCGKQVTSFKKTYYVKKAAKYSINTTLATVYFNNNQYPVLSITALVK
jgi:membrane-associated phospholipid phosphatase